MFKNKSPLITLTTDFGQRDGYVGAMRGVILNICPEAVITDLTHQIPPQDVQTAAFILYQSFAYYPLYTIHCVVVDPGVGSKRRAIAMQTDRGIFVGPDNGVFSLVLGVPNLNISEAVTLTNTDYQLDQISATFHGRDIFAPTAAHLARGVLLRELGPPAINLVRLDLIKPTNEGHSRIIHIDHFGNLVLSLTAESLINPDHTTFTIGKHTIKSLSYTFADVDEGELLAYVGSSRNHIEIAIRNGNAAKVLGVKLGDEVTVKDT